ncbi:MAG: hypothetical protein R3352_00855 [Salinisphaeraceae bacterium]|nr:hypothetical protein [Salinisphaeraceae bacterium]
MQSSFERHFYYWILPTFSIVMIGLLYYTGIPILQTIIAPEITRELGLLENTQHLLIIGVICLAVYGYRRSESKLEHFGFAAAVCLATVQLLEEINYGQHYLALFDIVPPQREVGPMSLHNVEGVSSQLKRVGDLVILLYFFLFPLLAANRGPAWLRYLAPPKLIALTVLCSVLVTKFFHFVSDNTSIEYNAFDRGVSEFRETFTYYFVMVYIYELAHNRRWPGFGKTGKSIYRNADNA